MPVPTRRPGETRGDPRRPEETGTHLEETEEETEEEETGTHWYGTWGGRRPGHTGMTPVSQL
jgi:hypothetical protein